MPENEISELADNFFCHLHSHCAEEHTHSSSELLIDSLNPLIIKKEQKLRKSILENQTLLIMNENHLNLDKIKVDKESLAISCSCGYNIGYIGKYCLKFAFLQKISKLFFILS